MKYSFVDLVWAFFNVVPYKRCRLGPKITIAKALRCGYRPLEEVGMRFIKGFALFTVQKTQVLLNLLI